MMHLKEKIKILESVLLQKNNYADSFKADIVMYFDDDFTVTNKQFHFLNLLQSQKEIQNWVDILTSRFVMKFDSESETENDFIYNYLQDKL